MLDLGPPLRTHYKEDQRMTIHSTSKVSERGTESECKETQVLYMVMTETSHYRLL